MQNLPSQQFDILATTAFGLESVVVRELNLLGYQAKPIATGRVLFHGDGLAVCRANLWLRAADRVLIRLASFEAADFEVLFQGVKALSWEQWVPQNFAFPVAGRSVKSQLSSVPAVQRTVKKAIVERLMWAHGARSLPETGPTVAIEVALLNNQATLTIDTSGAGLHKRGYRPQVGEAALKETLAAGLVLLSGWRTDWPGSSLPRPLVDPFCGTGTIAIEAAMIARNIAPGLKREFDAEQWPAISQDDWRTARDQAKAARTGPLKTPIIATDCDPYALEIARESARRAGVGGVPYDIRFAQKSFEQLSSELEYGCIVTNPPYGVRIGDDVVIDRLYRTMPSVLRKLPTWSFHILSGRLDLEQLFGQRATRRRKLYNSQIECTYFSFLGPRPPKDGVLPAVDQTGDDVAEGRDGSEEAGGVAEREPPVEAVTPRSDAGPVTTEEDEADQGEEAAVQTVRIPSAVVGPVFGGLRERDFREADEFGRCLANNVRHLRKWPGRGITCYRLYDRDYPDVPLIIDRYEDRVHVAEYERRHSRSVAQQADWIDLMCGKVAQVVGVPPEHVYMKDKPRQRGLTQHEKRADEQDTIIAQEGGLRFEVNLTDYIDTGLFLDHRQTRAMVRQAAPGKRMLNLFCYTGSFTVYAAAGGAAETTSVDLSNTYLSWAQRNLQLNNLWPGPHKLVRSDVIDFLHEQKPSPSYDLVVIDPPTFSNSTSTEMDWEVASRHGELMERLVPLLAPGALVFFSTNFRRFKLDESVLAGLGLRWHEITNQTIPPDFRNKRIHRCWKMTFAGGAEQGDRE